MKILRNMSCLMVFITVLFLISSVSAADAYDNLDNNLGSNVTSYDSIHVDDEISDSKNSNVVLENLENNNVVAASDNNINQDSNNNLIGYHKQNYTPSYNWNILLNKPKVVDIHTDDMNSWGLNIYGPDAWFFSKAVIYQNTIVDGHGHTVKFSQNESHFYAFDLVKGTTVIKNLIFDGNGNYFWNSGLIFIHKDASLILENCTIRNCIFSKATCDSDNANDKIRLTFVDNALILNEGKNKISIFDCLFDSNSAKYGCIFAPGDYGGLICSKGTVDVVNSIFKNGRSDIEFCGGAIFTKGNVIVRNSMFSNNHGGWGGAIHAKGDVEIDDSIFINNLANKKGGGAVFGNHVYVSNSLFDSNIAKSNGPGRLCGGAILSNKVNVMGCVFKNNYAHSSGGAIYSDMTTISNLAPSFFIDNVAYERGGGAIYTDTMAPSIQFAVFVNNHAGDGASNDGGAIYINSCLKDHCKNVPYEFSYCIFINNHCTDEGGAIYMDSSSALANLFNNIFAGNNADDTGHDVFTKGHIQYIKGNYWSTCPSSDNDQLIEWTLFINKHIIGNPFGNPIDFCYSGNGIGQITVFLDLLHNWVSKFGLSVNW